MNIGNLPAYLPLFISPSPRLSLSLPPLSPSRSLSLSLPLSFSLPLSLVRFRLVLGSWQSLLLSSRLEGLGFRFFLLVWGLLFARPGRKPPSLPATPRLAMSCVYECGMPAPVMVRKYFFGTVMGRR